MNEAGSVSIDGPRAGTLAEQVMNLAGGCVCCDTRKISRGVLPSWCVIMDRMC